MSSSTQTSTATHIKALGGGPPSEHFNNWPNAAGFNASQDQIQPVALQVKGTIPDYAAGTLYRTGPGHYTVDTNKGEYRLDHWFDGFTHIHRFQIETENGSTRVTYNGRNQVDKLIENIRQDGKLNGPTFGQKRDPCESLFSKLKQTFNATHRTPITEPGLSNVGVTLSLNRPGFQNPVTGKPVLVTATDATPFSMIDPELLEPLGATNQASLHPELNGPLSAAHAQRDPVTGDVYNYNLAMGAKEVYRIFKTLASTGQTEILATISGRNIKSAYVHSLFLTQNHVVLCLWPAYFAGKGAKVLWERNLLDAISFDKNAKCQWLVVDRTDKRRGLVATYTSPAMFSFHTVNAWEADGKDGVDIFCELVEFPNTDILHKLYYKNLVSNGTNVSAWSGPDINTCLAGTIKRYRLTGVPLTKNGKVAPAEVALEVAEASGELPTIHPGYTMKPHRYVYTVLGEGKSSFVEVICKTDTVKQTALKWTRQNHTPGEPIFVPDPQGKSEDDGVLLSVVLNGDTGTSYLLCLDAKNLEELGSADAGIPVGLGFHGVHYPASL